MGKKTGSGKRKITYYKLQSINKPSPEDIGVDEVLFEGAEFEIQGELENHIIISVPPTMSERSVRDLLEGLKTTVNRSVIIVTHNVQFLRAEKISFKEAKSITKQVVESAEDETDKEDGPDEMGREPAKIYRLGDSTRDRKDDTGSAGEGAPGHSTESKVDSDDIN